METIHFTSIFWGYAQVFLAPILTTIVSIIYFMASPKQQPLQIRLIASAHGATIALLYLTTIAIAFMVGNSPSYARAFMFINLIPLGFIVATFFIFEGSKIIHVLQVINLVCFLWCYFISSVAITGDFL